MTTPLMIKFKKLYPDAILPTRESERAAALDLYSIQDVALLPGQFSVIRTGLQMEPPIGHEVQIRPRSGMAAKYGVTVLNTPGTVDEDYRGEVCVILINHGTGIYHVRKGDRIAQMVTAKVVLVDPYEAKEGEELSTTSRGDGGFGSTGR